MLTPTQLRSLGCLWALKWLRVLEWLGIHATKIFKNLVDKNKYDKTTSIPAIHLQSFYRFFVFFHFVSHPKNFPKVATGTRLIRISESATGIRLIRVSKVAPGYPIISGDDQNPTRPVHRVPEFIGYPHTSLIFYLL